MKTELLPFSIWSTYPFTFSATLSLQSVLIPYKSRVPCVCLNSKLKQYHCLLTKVVRFRLSTKVSHLFHAAAQEIETVLLKLFISPNFFTAFGNLMSNSDK